MQFTWVTPNNSYKTVSITIEKIFLGYKDIINNNTNNNLCNIHIITISEKIYREIIKYLNLNFNNNNNDNNNNNFQYLKFNKKTQTLKKVEKKKLFRFALTICPVCQYSNCVECTKAKYNKYMKRYCDIFKKKKTTTITTITTDNGIPYPRYIKCFNCHNIFSTRRHNNFYPLLKCLGYQCNACEKKYSKLYEEFLIYYYQELKCVFPLKNILNKHYGDITTLSRKKKIQHIYEHYLSPEAQKQLNFDYKNLYYHLKVKKAHSERIVIIPPLAFFTDMNKPPSFFIKLLDDDNAPESHLDVKSQYGSVNSRAQGGKNSIFRNTCLNKRYTGSARAVIVPRQCLLPHECILPRTIFKALNCPRHVLLHRYPTLDIRSMTYHEVVETWAYPSIAISTAIVSGNNADFDGDCVHVIPATNLATQAELIYLCHPKRNMIVQNQLRVNFDHDEIETLYSQFGLDRPQIHKLIFEVARKSSIKAYNLFCLLKRYCEWIWTFQGVATVTFNDFSEIIKKNGDNVDYNRFVECIFQRQIKPNNGIKKIIQSRASRFSVNHLWQMFGYINEEAKDAGGFLGGMSKASFIKMARLSRLAMIKDVSYYGYSQIKLVHCTKSFLVNYDDCLYTTDGLLVAKRVSDIY